MAVTKRGWLILLILPIAGSLLFAFQNCAVEISDQTYGAASACAPTADELTAFNTPLTTILQNATTLTGGGTGCALCHSSTSTNPARARFGILPGTDAAAVEDNWCTVQGYADDFINGFLSGGSHNGGVYTNAQVQALIDWAAALGQ